MGLALAASWLSVWALYAAYTWTARPFGTTLQVARFYVPATGAIALLGSWLVTRLPRRTSLAMITSAAVAVAMFGLGTWSFATTSRTVIEQRIGHSSAHAGTSSQGGTGTTGRSG